jgi:hypothetical protein
MWCWRRCCYVLRGLSGVALCVSVCVCVCVSVCVCVCLCSCVSDISLEMEIAKGCIVQLFDEVS